MTKTAYFDCLSGIAGDMTLGALIDAGADLNEIQAAVKSMGLPDLQITTTEVKKCGFRAIAVSIEHPPEHAHRHLHHITQMIDGADQITEKAKTMAKNIFHEVAVAEAKVHGSTLEKVHFHEVGAIDSIADIVGTSVAMTSLGITAVESSPVPVGGGSIMIAHGRVSIPAPATAEILKGVPIAESTIQAELTTPTGAAILKANARRFGPMPAMTIEAIGFGAGTKDFEGQANVLRVLIGQTLESAEGTLADEVVVMETNLDDCTPEVISACAEILLRHGALDVFQTPCVMKKGRSGVVLTVIAPVELSASLEAMVFEQTSTIGIRIQTIRRSKLSRETTTLETKFGPLAGKTVVLPSGRRRFKPEHDEVVRIAAQNNVSMEEVVD